VPNFKVERILPQNFTAEFRSSLKLKLILQLVSNSGDLLTDLRRDKLQGDGELSLTEIIMACIAWNSTASDVIYGGQKLQTINSATVAVEADYFIA
jgi:hypothetical protein